MKVRKKSGVVMPLGFTKGVLVVIAIASLGTFGCASGGPQPECGNGLLEADEVCDDGSTDVCGSCNVDCTGPGAGATCGDGELCAETESCDDGYTDVCGSCNADCSGDGTGATCGDNVFCMELEACDDGYTDDCGSCNADCSGQGVAPTCGDGDLCPEFEACDDAYMDDCGSCNADCSDLGTGSTCGDADLCLETEVCDMGADPCNDCSGDCLGAGAGPVCGDNKVCTTNLEECDDGNTISGDGCDANCLLECDPITNIAPNATGSSSGGGSGTYGPDKMNNGNLQNTCEFHWVSAGSSPGNSWISYTWSGPTMVGRIAIDTQPSTSSQCSSSGRNLAGGTVQWWDGGTWIDDGVVSGQTDDWTYTFSSPVTTTAIRIYGVHTSNTGQASNPMIFEWMVYGC